MTKISKRHFNNKNLIDPERKYDLQEAIAILKDATNAKFEESIDVAINLGIDPKLFTNFYLKKNIAPYCNIIPVKENLVDKIIQKKIKGFDIPIIVIT